MDNEYSTFNPVTNKICHIHNYPLSNGECKICFMPNVDKEIKIMEKIFYLIYDMKIGLIEPLETYKEIKKLMEVEK